MVSAGERLTVGEAVAKYLSTLKEDREGVQQELNSFARWFGRDRLARDLAPQEVAEFGGLLVFGPSEGALRRVTVLKGFLAFLKKEGLASENLGAYLRVPRTVRRPSSAAPQPPSSAPIQLTPQGRAQLEARLEMLRAELVQASEEVRRAATDKDVRENAPLEAARERHGLIASRIQEIEAILARSQVAPEAAAPGKVRPGSRVTVQELSSGRETTYTLVAPQEANPLEGKVSVTSPVGQALLEKEAGGEVQVAVPRGTLAYRILKVE